MLTAFDAWLGKHLFHPPIIWFCEVSRQTQYAVSRLFWFVAALDGLYRATTTLTYVIFGALSLVLMVTASFRADLPTRSSRWMRMISVAFLTFDILVGAATSVWAGVEFWFLVLVAEYASTIRTIPSRRKKPASAVLPRTS